MTPITKSIIFLYFNDNTFQAASLQPQRLTVEAVLWPAPCLRGEVAVLQQGAPGAGAGRDLQEPPHPRLQPQEPHAAIPVELQVPRQVWPVRPIYLRYFVSPNY
eukprot:scaffold398064_cov19-Prasinocladus_malaysianus.AAC.1